MTCGGGVVVAESGSELGVRYLGLGTCRKAHTTCTERTPQSGLRTPYLIIAIATANT